MSSPVISSVVVLLVCLAARMRSGSQRKTTFGDRGQILGLTSDFVGDPFDEEAFSFMDLPQILYLGAFSVYLIFFILFARFFFWKHYSDKLYWGRRPVLSEESLRDTAQRLGKEIPWLSLLIPARNESEVIENTIVHMLSLTYPRDRYEVIVATDEKELLAARKSRPRIVRRVLDMAKSLEGGKRKPAVSPEEDARAKELMVAVLASYALQEYLNKDFHEGLLIGVPELQNLPAATRETMIREVSVTLHSSSGRASSDRIIQCIKRTCPWLSRLDLERLYPVCLVVAMPALAAYVQIAGEDDAVLRKAINKAARANHGVTQDIIRRMTNHIARSVVNRFLTDLKGGELGLRIRQVQKDLFPTTQEVVEKVKKDLPPELSRCLKHVVVPDDFDGEFPGRRTGVSCPSTKGRALNWALRFVNPQAEVCGFYDAESRPEKCVLLYVAYRRLIAPDKCRILQGPVFQVRNFYQMTAFCRIASLYQAIAHDWYLSWLFRTLPFVGGTNLFVSYELLKTIGGWDHQVLTEDLELGTRAYLLQNAWPEYLPYFSSEQTPPTFKSFFRQRLRWGTGHIQVVSKVSKFQDDPTKRRELLKALIKKGQMEWTLYQCATFVPPIAMGLYARNLLDPSVIPVQGQWALNVFSFVYLGFTLYAYRRYRRYFDTGFKPSSFVANVGIFLGLFILPMAAFMFPVPYTSAMILRAFGREPRIWEKTPRTKEAIA